MNITELVFIFPRILRFVQKDRKLKVYLRRQKMNNDSTFVSIFHILNVTFIMGQKWYYARWVQKVSSMKLYLLRQKWTMNWIIFVP